jgi:hypothetical protein
MSKRQKNPNTEFGICWLGFVWSLAFGFWDFRRGIPDLS